MINHKTIIWQLLGGYVYYHCFLVMSEVSNVSANVRVRLPVVKTPWMKIRVSFGKSNFTTKLWSDCTACELLVAWPVGLCSEKVAPRFTFSKMGSNHSCRISLILHSIFAKCLIALSIATSIGSRNVYRICVQLFMANVLSLTGPSDAHCLICGFHCLFSSYHMSTINSS